MTETCRWMTFLVYCEVFLFAVEIESTGVAEQTFPYTSSEWKKINDLLGRYILKQLIRCMKCFTKYSPFRIYHPMISTIPTLLP